MSIACAFWKTDSYWFFNKFFTAWKTIPMRGANDLVEGAFLYGSENFVATQSHLALSFAPPEGG